jgi:uncharacterized GH25 family protein
MKSIFLFTFFVVVTSGIFAHDLYLQSKPFLLSQPGSVKLSMFLAESFPGEAQKWRAEKTVSFQLLGPSGPKDLDHREQTDPSISLPSEGTYVIGWSATPSYITIDAKHFEEYVRAEGYSNVLDKKSPTVEGKEKYTRYLKTFLQVGNKTTVNYPQPLGHKIEILPTQNPYALKAGGVLTVQVLFEGKPLASTRVMGTFDTFSKEHDVYAETSQTDSNGRAQIKITKPGIWMICANHMIPAQNDPKADWESFWSNCSFQIGVEQ